MIRLLVAMVVAIPCLRTANAATTTVPDHQSTIQAAILAASPSNEVRSNPDIGAVEAMPIPVTCPLDNFGLPSGCNVTPPAGTMSFNIAGGPTPNPAFPTVTGGVPPMMLTFSDATTDVGCIRTLTRTYRITDMNGDFGECDQTFTWTADTEPPMITCPADATVDCDDASFAAVNGLIVGQGGITFPACPGGAQLPIPATGIPTSTPGIEYAAFTGGLAIYFNNNGAGEVLGNEAFYKSQFTLTNTHGAEHNFAAPPLPWATLYGQCPFNIACPIPGTPTQFGFDMIEQAVTSDGTNPTPTLTAVDNVDNTIGGVAPVGSVSWAINDYKGAAPNGSANLLTSPINSIIRSNSPASVSDLEFTRFEVTTVGTISTLEIEGMLISNGCHNWFDPLTPHTPMNNFGMNGLFFFCGTLTFDSNGNDPGDLIHFYQGSVQITVNSPLNVGVPVVTDNCTAIPLITSLDVNIPGSCVGNYTIARTWAAIDGCGNSSSCTQMIAVQDTTAPTFTVPMDATIECDEDPNDSMLTGDVTDEMDNCDMMSGPANEVWINEFHYDNAGGDVGEFIEVAGTAGFDLSSCDLILYNGNGGASYNTINLSGIIPDESMGFGAVSFAVAGIQNGAPDGMALVCMGIVIEFISYEGSFTATNGPAIGLMSMNVGVQETGTTPIGQSLQLTGTGNTASAFTWSGPGAESPGSLNMGQTVTMASSGNLQAMFMDAFVAGCGTTGVITRTWTLTDACGNSNSQDQLITIIDTVAPTFTVPMDITIECDQDEDDLTITGDVTDEMDNCDMMGVNPDEVWINEFHYDNAGGDVGEFFEVAGTAGFDLSNCDMVLYNGVNGTVYNTINLAGIIPDEGLGFGAISFSLPVNGLQNGAPDGMALVCMGIVIEFISYEGSFTATNGPAIGLMSMNVGVQETGTTPIGQSLQLTGTGNTASAFTWSGPGAESPGLLNNGQTMTALPPPMGPDATFTNAFVAGCGTTGIVTRTWTLSDGCGNSSSADQTITIQDTGFPTFTLPADVTIECSDDPTNLGLTGNLSAIMDNCDMNPMASFSDVEDFSGCGGYTGTITRTWTVADACGNSTSQDQNITVQDITPPTFTVPADITIECTEDVNDTSITGDVIDEADNCDGAPVMDLWINEFHYDNAGGDVGEFIEIAGTTGLDLSDYQIFIYNGFNGTVFGAPTNLAGIIPNESMGFGAVSFPIAGIMNGAPDGFALVQISTTNVIQFLSYEGDFIATNGPAIGMMSTNVGVFETGGTPIGFSLQLTGTGSAYPDFTWIPPTPESPGSLNTTQTMVALPPPVGGPVVTFVDAVISNDPCNGAVTRTWTVTDACGNSLSQDQSIAIQDTQPPNVTFCPGDITIQLEPFACEARVFYDLEAEDDCNGFMVDRISGQASGTLYPIGVFPHRFEFTDDCNNTSVCEFNVTILEYPETGQLACNGNIQVSLDPTCQAEITADMILEGEAGCIDDFVVTVFDGPNPNFANVLPTSPFVTINEIDQVLAVMISSIEFGTSCWGTILVEDKTPPIITCPADFTLSCDSLAWFLAATPIPVGTLSATAAALPVSITDNNTVSATTTTLIGGTGTVNGRIVDVNVNVGIDHSWVNDLTLTLTSPAGTSVTLLQNMCGNEEQILATFDDEAASGPQCATGNPTILGSVTPASPLTAFDGEVPSAAWTLDVNDNVGGDQGFIHGFSVDMQIAALSGEPDVVENCCLDNTWFEDLVDVNTCGIGTVTRTWFAVDCYKNEASCQQVVSVVPNMAPGIVWPQDIQHDCGLSRDQLTPEDLEGDPNSGTDGVGFVFLGTADDTWVDVNTGRVYNNQFDPEFNYVRPRLTNDDYCGDIAFNYDDQLFDVCLPYGFKIRRTWTVLDWCDPNFEVSHIQIIKVIDDEAPVITCPTDKTIGTSHTNCFAFLTPDPVIMSDNCDSNPQVADIKYTDFNDIELPTTQVGPGRYKVKYTISDACGNETACIQLITVVDIVPPVAICDANTNVSLTAVSGWADLCAVVIDDGSYDNCGPIILEIRAPNLPFPQNVFQPCVRFFCTNIGTHIVELRVWDDGNGNGIVGPNDAFNFDNDPTNDDNWNVCWANVNIEDKLPPSIICPADITVDCTVDFTDPLFTGGYALGQDACTAPPVIWQDFGITSCVGAFTRRWTASKEITLHDGTTITLTATCDQTIAVIDPTPASVEFPADITLDCPVVGTEPGDLSQYNGPNAFYDQPSLAYDCEQIGISRDDEIFDVCLPASYKIRRTWHVVDWCDPNFDLTHYQVIKIQDIIQPEILVNGNQGPDKSDPTSPPAHNLFVQIQNNDAACHEWVEIHATSVDNCSASTISNDSPYSDSGSGYDASGYYPKGTHTFSFFAIDDCGNVREEAVVITVVDAKAPLVQCLTQSIAMKSTGMISVSAETFNGGSIDNCTDQANLTFQLQLVDANDSPLDDPQNPLVLDCDQIGINYVRLIVTDASNNSAYCVTTLLLEDPNGYCPDVNPDVASITGTMKTQLDEFVGPVNIYVNGVVALFGEIGAYATDKPINQSYTVRPSKNDDVRNGVSTIDIVYLRRHLLDKGPFTHPYQWIAGDVNNDQQISTIDIAFLRRVILEKTDAFPNNQSWRFVDQGYRFTTSQPLTEQFPEEVTAVLSNAGLHTNFASIKIGDLNGDVDPVTNDGNKPDRFNKSFELKTNNLQLRSGSQYQIPVTSENFNQIEALQFTLEFDTGLSEFIGFESAAMAVSDDNYSMHKAQSGLITFSWDDISGFSASADEVLFYLVFEVHVATDVSKLFDLVSSITRAEAYSFEDGKMELRMDFVQKTSEPFALFQNEPNPFADQTDIPFYNPNADQIQLSIFDSNGKLVFKTEKWMEFGKQAFTVDKKDLSGSGVYYYELKTSTVQSSKTMLLVE